ncbi:MAG: proline racemase [Thermoproteota archaeon]|jgi:proline racemase|uniref:Proline racemase n=1 Tax=Candidatus Methanodesulfokora washburnensis TaxID=2478471 RepID=A0A520KPP4_9CREN|nr:MAG: proline racemase [Candidatus Methanodesulfokores washburnensis]TDA40823.1 MAG: proline racemase [Candidatus Korarchaeota archaeon]
MKLQHIITTIDTHTAGEPTRIIISGVPPLYGKDIVEKRNYFIKNLDNIRRALMLEPRGHKDMFGAILLPSTREDCDFGVIFLDAGGSVDMCIHGTIGVVTALISTGLVQRKEPITEVKLDTCAGPVTATARVEGDVVKEVTVRNVPSFLANSNIEIKIPDVGTVPVDIAFGGNFYAIVKAQDIGIRVEPQYADRISKLGILIRDIVNREIRVEHPINKHINTVKLVRIVDEPKNSGVTSRNAVIFGPGQIDRSPCGTGTCAEIAMRYSKGLLGIGEEIVCESIIGTRFKGKAVAEVMVGNFKAVIPEVTGRAFITGFHHFVIDEEDPLKEGFLL